MTLKKELLDVLQDWAERLQADLRDSAAENIHEWVDDAGSPAKFASVLYTIRDEDWPGTFVAVLCDAYLGALEDCGYDLEDTGNVAEVEDEWTEEDEEGLLEEFRQLAKASATR